MSEEKKYHVKCFRKDGSEFWVDMTQKEFDMLWSEVDPQSVTLADAPIIYLEDTP
jgi:hypothetical protein